MTLISNGFDVRASVVAIFENIAAEIQSDLRSGIAANHAALVGLPAGISLTVAREKAPEAFHSLQIWFFDGAGISGRQFVERFQLNILTRSEDPNTPDDRLLLIIRDTLMHKLSLRSGKAQFKAYFTPFGYFADLSNPIAKRNAARLEFANASGWGPLPDVDDDPYVSGITRDFNIFYK